MREGSLATLSRPARDAPAAREGGWSRGGGDRAAAQDGLTVIEDRRLAPRDATGWCPQPDPEQVAVEARGRRMDLAMRPQLGQAAEGLAGWLAPGPHRALRRDVEHVE